MLCNTDEKYTKQIVEHGANVSISNLNHGFNFWFSFFPRSFHNFFILICPDALQHQRAFLWIKNFGQFQQCFVTSSSVNIYRIVVYHVPDGHIAQFPVLCDYIEQGRAKQLETHKKFKEVCGCL
jgi:hypothetical protein